VGKFIPVEPEKWAKMVKAMAENARLKAECQARQAENSVLAVECDSLKAEAERVGSENSHLHKGIYSLSLNVGQLKDEVERLTKAGDRVLHTLLWTDEYDEFRYKDAKKIWDAAKEGKQS
jgi:uncharacterized protein (DUF3084 family)